MISVRELFTATEQLLTPLLRLATAMLVERVFIEKDHVQEDQVSFGRRSCIPIESRSSYVMSTSHPSRFYREVAAGRLTAAELATIHRNEEQRLEAFQGYTDLTTSTRRANRSIFDDFQIWYQNVYQGK